MTKVIIAGTLITSIFLNITAFVDPIYPVSWLASTSLDFALIRTFLAVLLLALLVTNPPRKIYFRSIMAISAVVTLALATSMFGNFRVALLDYMLFILASINFAIAALEPIPSEETNNNYLFVK